jgi:hypothetical protein
MIEELHIDSINRDHETNYGARSYTKKRAYSNIMTVDCDNDRDNNCDDINDFKI